ncbi:MAG: YfbK domain-containing protein [Bacillota bacterium]
MKKIIKILSIIIVLSLTFTLLISCGKNGDYIENNMGYPNMENNPNDSINDNQNEFNEIVENDFIEARDNPSSIFSLSVNTAGYSLLRRTINDNSPIDKNQIKTEEIVNYFKYDYPNPEEGEPLSLNANLFDCPWSDGKLLTVGLKAEELDITEVRNNLVFLLDVSGSMRSHDKLGLLKNAFLMMLENLDENDMISIVTYASKDEVLLSGANGGESVEISQTIEELEAGGSTAGSQGIQTAYSLAEDYFIEDGNNRVILATDGDFNVGISNQTDLEDFISTKRESGIYLTVLGFGYGNLKDNNLETLANKGDGNYGYIDTINEARRVLVEEIGGTLNTVARDAKAKVIFNPAKVRNYRLIGYENLLLTEEEWEDSNTDAGEIGSGFTVTAVYELDLEDSEEPSTMDDNLLKVEVKYKSPDKDDDTEREMSVFADESNITSQPTEDMLFISAVVETCLLLRESQYKGEANINNVLTRLNNLDNLEDNSYRLEFKGLVEKLIEDYFIDNSSEE